MSKIGKNIQKIRKVKKLSQTAFSELFGLSRTSVGAYEEGRAEPKTDTLIQIAKYFGLSIDSLLTKTIAVNDLYKFSKYDDKFLTDAKPSQGVDRFHVVMEEVVTHYIEHIGESEFLDGLPSFSLPFLELKNARIFQSGQDYLICTPNFSNGAQSYLVVTSSGVVVRSDLPKESKSVLEIWEVKAHLSLPKVGLVGENDRITKLEQEVEEIKKLLKK